MGAKGEAFAKQFEAKVEEASALLEKLSDTDWKKTCTKAETIALHKTAAAAAAAAVRDLSDGELAKTGIVFTGMPPVSAEELVKRILLGHVDAHFGSIRKTIGG